MPLTPSQELGVGETLGHLAWAEAARSGDSMETATKGLRAKGGSAAMETEVAVEGSWYPPKSLGFLNVGP